MTEDIRYRRINTLPNQPFTYAWIGWRKFEDGSLTVGAFVVGRLQMTDMLRKHGRQAVRNCVAFMKREVARQINAVEQPSRSAEQPVELPSSFLMTREQFEEICLGKVV